MYSTDFLQNSEYVYEEVAKLSPPSQLLDASSSSPFFGGPNSPTPYNPQMMGDNPQSMPVSQNMASPMSNGALSPQHMQASVLSPQQMQVASPQSNLGSPINMSANSPVSMPYGGQMMQASSGASVQGVSEIHRQSIVQPVQDTHLSVDNLEADFMANQFNQYQGGMGQYGEAGMYNQPPYQQFSQQSCAFQARGTGTGTDRDLQDVLDIIGNQGYDEVDCSRIDMPPAPHFSHAIPMTEKLVSRGGSQKDDLVDLSAKFSDQASINFTAKVQRDYNKMPQSTSVQTESVLSTENKAVQTRDNGGKCMHGIYFYTLVHIQSWMALASWPDCVNSQSCLPSHL